MTILGKRVILRKRCDVLKVGRLDGTGPRTGRWSSALQMGAVRDFLLFWCLLWQYCLGLPVAEGPHTERKARVSIRDRCWGHSHTWGLTARFLTGSV